MPLRAVEIQLLPNWVLAICHFWAWWFPYNQWYRYCPVCSRQGHWCSSRVGLWLDRQHSSPCNVFFVVVTWSSWQGLVRNESWWTRSQIQSVYGSWHQRCLWWFHIASSCVCFWCFDIILVYSWIWMLSTVSKAAISPASINHIYHFTIGIKGSDHVLAGVSGCWQEM